MLKLISHFLNQIFFKQTKTHCLLRHSLKRSWLSDELTSKPNANFEIFFQNLKREIFFSNVKLSHCLFKLFEETTGKSNYNKNNHKKYINIYFFNIKTILKKLTMKSIISYFTIN